MIVDCHTHWTAGPADTTPDTQAWLQRARSNGVRHAVVLPTLGLLHDGYVKFDHEQLSLAATGSEGLMLPFCTAKLSLPGAVDELERCLRDLHFRGIKFHPWLQGTNILSSSMDAACELSVQYGVPILFHDGTPPFSLPAQVALLARRHPRAQLILGHCGLLEHWREALSALTSTPNLWGCLCGPHLAGLRQLVAHGPEDRLVWGSDAGFGTTDPYPYRLDLIEALQLPAERARRLFWGNAAELFRLDGGA